MLGKSFNCLKKLYNDNKNKHEYDKEEFTEIMKELLNNDAVRELKMYTHHGDTSCFRHSMHVAYFNYKICKKLGLDAKAAAKAGMLHDLFLYDWHDREIKLGESLHGFDHPYIALKNARKNFELTHMEEDIIEKHMFPLTPRFPRYKETIVIILTDKLCSVGEVLDGIFRKSA